MMTLNWPWWLILVILGVENWPVLLIAGLVLALLAAATRGWLRGLAIVLALPCAASVAIAAVWGIHAHVQDRETAEYDSKVNEVLDREQVVNGVPLPAGTAIQWRDIDHVQMRTASPPAPIPLFGVHVSWLSRADDGTGWDVQLPEPEDVERWTCETIGVRLSDAGRLLSCRLAADRQWQGWPIPAGSLLDRKAEEGKAQLTLPIGGSRPAPEIGHALTSTGSFTLNSDGSPDSFYFESDDPLLVAGMKLWNTVEWTYDPATARTNERSSWYA